MHSEKKRLNLFKNYKNLKDNVTHGFLAALKCLKNSTARDIVKKLTGLNLKSNIFYDIQSPSFENDKRFKDAESGYLLGISSVSTDVREDTSSKKESRADGWISDGEKVILIESKVVSQFSEDQLKRHEEKLRKRYRLNVKLLKSITWQDVDCVLNSYTKRENISKIERKILLEYRRYLQMEGITLDLEKFFNAVDFDIGKNWYSDEPKET
ncbi:PD-(D/E)XK nuclease family protein, partial [candidate division WOR-3 bacterium]|nr:PD-(D/E)XK nuclease family protein [candidate division WOR-3 bacterium]